MAGWNGSSEAGKAVETPVPVKKAPNALRGIVKALLVGDHLKIL